MRYIRTKYNTIADVSHLGIEGLLKDRLGEYEEFSAATKNGWLAYLYADDIAKEADTIEELCDCFVDYCEEDDSHFVSTAIQGKHEIYGAIWTDKGLIYVAKMNGKGEFELL